MRKFLKDNYLAILITIILFIIPFFWLSPGEMDLGGDENRLFFYDPKNYLYNDGLFLFETVTSETRSFEPHFYNLPLVLLLLGIKTLINSPYFLISLINGIKISIAFLSIYLIIKAILQYSFKERNELLLHMSSILGGLLYITAPIIIGNYDKALLSHNQVFLNPICFYLLLQYFFTKKFRYLFLGILITVLFTQNFSWTGAPPFFAFYLLALPFLFFYVVLIQKQKIILSHIIWAIVLFLGFHAFHLIPEILNLLSPGSYINERVFNKDNVAQYLNYFYGVLSSSKLSLNLLLYAPFKQFAWLNFIPVLAIVLGFIFSKRKNRIFLLTGSFFLITLYLVTANITAAGVKLYELFFYIPGFSMFRNFIGQWAFVFTFFYALLFGQALYFLYKKINRVGFISILSLLISVSLIASSWMFFMGKMVNTVHFQSDNVKIPIIIDPNYEKTLDFIRTIKDDGAFISLPFTDCCFSVIHGINNGAYVGPSPINRLVGKTDYNGYIVISPFAELMLSLVKEKKYEEIKKLFGLLDIKYIYYNDDPKIYDKTFPGYPYGTVRNYFPQTQDGYKTFIKNIAGKEIYHKGNYHIYKTDSAYENSKFYIPKYINKYTIPHEDLPTQTKPFFDSPYRSNILYIEDKSCPDIFPKSQCLARTNQLKDTPQIRFEKINPMIYRVHVKNAKKGYLLVFSKSFHKQWDIALTTNNVIKDIFWQNKIGERQVLANGYANAWYILPKDVGNKTEYTLTVQMTDQRIFYLGLAISLLTVIISLLAAFFLSRK